MCLGIWHYSNMVSLSCAHIFSLFFFLHFSVSHSQARDQSSHFLASLHQFWAFSVFFFPNQHIARSCRRTGFNTVLHAGFCSLKVWQISPFHVVYSQNPHISFIWNSARSLFISVPRLPFAPAASAAWVVLDIAHVTTVVPERELCESVTKINSASQSDLLILPILRPLSASPHFEFLKEDRWVILFPLLGRSFKYESCRWRLIIWSAPSFFLLAFSPQSSSPAFFSSRPLFLFTCAYPKTSRLHRCTKSSSFSYVSDLPTRYRVLPRCPSTIANENSRCAQCGQSLPISSFTGKV